MQPPAIPVDLPSMMLAHPFRSSAFCAANSEEVRALIGPHEWAAFTEILRDNSVLLGDIMNRIQRKGLFRLDSLTRLSGNAEGSTEWGGAMPYFATLRHLEAPYPIFRIEDKLVDILSKTDISDDVSVSMLPMPYPRLYLELGQARNLSETISNIASGEHILEGAYIEQGTHERSGEGYYIILTGSPLGKENALDDATVAVFVRKGTGEVSLRDELMWAVKSTNADAREMGLRETPEEWMGQVHQCLLLIIKALLYISLPEARREAHPERTEALKALERLKSTAKRAKAERRMRKLSDYVVIKAAVAHEKTFSETAPREGGVKPHWRRAHYRMQAHGPRMSLRKLVFITETLVAAGEDNQQPAVSTYNVK